jgi:hypothetical protein
VSSGARKLDHNPHSPITKGAVEATQLQVDDMARMFFSAVAEHRGVSVDAVMALEGAILLADRGAQLRLVDNVVDSWSEFLARPRVKGNGPMASMKEARSAYRSQLAKLAAEDSDDGREAASTLAAMAEEDEKMAKKAAKKAESEKPKEEGEGDAKSKSEDGPPMKEESKARSEDDEKSKAKSEDEEKEPHAAAASVEAKTIFALTARVHALESDKAAKAEADERTALLATRPDFSAPVKASLEKAPIAFLREAVKDWPRGSTPARASAAATFPGGSRGDHASADGAPAERDDDREEREPTIQERMRGPFAEGGGIRHLHGGRTVELGFMTHEQAKAFLEKHPASAASPMGASVGGAKGNG